MRRFTLVCSLLSVAVIALTIGCTKAPEEPAVTISPAVPAKAAQPAAASAPAPEVAAAPDMAQAPAPVVDAAPPAPGPAATAQASAPEPQAAAKPAAEPAKIVEAPKPVEPAPAATDLSAAQAQAEPVKSALAPSPAPEPAATAASHAKVGAEKCKLCHKVQYASWVTSEHNAKGLDCEGCHGNGADYKSMAVMKDRAAAVKAGLILQTVSACKKCHPEATAELLPKAHAHKAK